MLPGQTDYKISRSERISSPMNPSQMSSDTEESGGLGTFAVCQEMTTFQRTAEERKTTEEVEGPDQE